MEISQQFIAQLQALLPHEWEALAAAITTTPPAVSIRLNTAKGAHEARTTGLDPVPWCPAGRYLAGREPFTFDTAFQTGLYYVQDASSMFIAHVIGSLVDGPVRYLDLCAAPGGKTTAAIQALPPGSTVVANEVMPQRARVLCENVTKWGSPRCFVTSNPASDFKQLRHYFDVVAVDAPCSGEGMMRKEAEDVAQWSPALVRQCAALQRSIVDDAWHALKPGGLLIYSTCTYNSEENEQVVQHLIDTCQATTVEVPVEAGWKVHPGIGTSAHCYRFMPHLTRGEGLFMAVLRKPEGKARPPKMKAGKARGNTAWPRGTEHWLDCAGDYSLAMRGDTIVAIPHDLEPCATLLHGALHVLHEGITLGTVKGRNCVPSHALALSTALNPEAFARCEVDYATAMAYMRGETVVVDAPRGYVLLTHHGSPIGFANNLGSRANNLYPKPWRILSTHIPAQEPAVVTAGSCMHGEG